MFLNSNTKRAIYKTLLPFVATLLTALLAGQALAAKSADDRPAARQTPDWLRDGVVYEIWPRAFSSEGTFKAVIPELDRLKKLGVNVLWLMPIHPVGKLKAKGSLGSPYAVRDYDAVNPEFGSSDDLKQLIAAAHQRDMKVFIDIVINHTAWDSVLMKHKDWYSRDASGQIIPPNPDWVDVADLDWSRPALRKYMTEMMVRWLRDYQIDGFRCDYASGVPTDFWNALRPELDKVRPGLAFLAESDDPALLRSAFDIDYAWDFYHVVNDALVGRKPASEIRAVWERAEARYPRGALRLRFSDNHDQLRTTGQAGLPAAMAASAVMFTLDGVPLLYNGMEVGDTSESAAPALFEDVPIRWDMAERRPHVLPYYESLLALRRAHRAFTRGAVRWLENTAQSNVVSFERVGEGETLVVVVNLSSQAYNVGINVAAARYQDITPPLQQPGESSPRAAAALPALTLAPWEFRVFRRATP